MNPLSRIRLELQQLAGPLGPAQMARYVGALALASPAIMRGRTLAPADARMSGDVSFSANSQPIIVPLTQIAALLRGYDSTPTFGAVREMYASNVYLRAFRPDVPLHSVVDLGANRGLFSLLALKGHGARIAIGVEPGPHFTPVAAALCAANGISAATMPREQKFIASTPGSDAVTMDMLMKRYGLKTIDFVKCDIEGGEYDVLLHENGFLNVVGNLAMEMHPEAGPTNTILTALRDKGFTVRTTDQFGAATDGVPHYLYASRTGHLA